MLTAALEIEYGAMRGRLNASIASVSPTPEDKVITLATPVAAVAFNKGRKALIVRTTPRTFVRNYVIVSALSERMGWMPYACYEVLL